MTWNEVFENRVRESLWAKVMVGNLHAMVLTLQNMTFVKRQGKLVPIGFPGSKTGQNGRVAAIQEAW
ncbi:MAG: hypothetical protein ACKPKO_30875, partial [Candidatus Fonsibacter sp.]